MVFPKDKIEISLKVGDEAPDFTLITHNEGELNLHWYQGRKNVILAFYPGDWTPVCASQIADYSQFDDLFEKYDCQLFGISVDSIFSHRAWAKSLGNITFPLMSDFYPHGKVSKKFGVFNPRGYSERVVFLIDKKGIIRYIEHPDIDQVPDRDELIRQLESLNNN